MRPRRSGVISVWLVEDHDYFRESIQQILSDDPGVDCVHSFANGEDVIAAMSSYSAPDVVLMDIGLPGMSGIEVTRHLRAVWKRTRVVVLTIYEQNERIRDAICAGATGYLLKSEAPQRVLEALRQAAGGRSAMTPLVARRVLHMVTAFSLPRQDYHLTDREGDVLRELVCGKSKKRIATDLEISFYTADTHVRKLYRKLEVHSKAEAIAKALRKRLVDESRDGSLP